MRRQTILLILLTASPGSHMSDRKSGSTSPMAWAGVEASGARGLQSRKDVVPS
jgi:hypothetical protein